MVYSFATLIYGISIPHDDNYKFEKLFRNYTEEELYNILKESVFYSDWSFEEDQFICKDCGNEINEKEKDLNKKNKLYKCLIDNNYRINFSHYRTEKGKCKNNNYIFPLPCCKIDSEENIIIGIPLKIPKEFRVYNTDKKLGNWDDEIDVGTLNPNFDYVDNFEVMCNPPFISKMFNSITEDIKLKFENIVDGIIDNHSDYFRGMFIYPNDCSWCS